MKHCTSVDTGFFEQEQPFLTYSMAGKTGVRLASGSSSFTPIVVANIAQAPESPAT